MATLLSISSGFSIISPPSKLATNSVSATTLYMSDRERTKSTKKGVKTIIRDKTESKAEEQKKKEEMWRVVLHNDEVHTFNYVIRSLCKVLHYMMTDKSTASSNNDLLFLDRPWNMDARCELLDG